MPLPASLTETQLDAYLAGRTVMGSVADSLSWVAGDSDPDDFAEIINDTRTLYGVDEITGAGTVR